MAYSTITTTGNGVLTSFTFPFTYNDQEDIVVKVGGVITPFTFTSANTIQLATAPASGVSVNITRTTPIESADVIFASPGALSPTLLNKNTDQLIYAVQEIWDNTNDTRDTLNRRISMGETPPFNPQLGDLWFDTTIAVMFIWYDDGDSKQWVEVNNANPGIVEVSPTAVVNLAASSGILPIANGGTGSPNKQGARANLGITVGPTAPSSPALYDLWVDTN